MSSIISPNFDKRITLDVYGIRYDFYRTPDRRWYYRIKNNGQVKKTSGSYAKGMIWMFGNRAQREEERLERQQLFENLNRKRARQLNTEYEESDIRRYLSEEVVI